MMQGEWVRTRKARTSVVFVHGILSSGERCWRHGNGTYWPDLLKNEPDLSSLGIYVFTYQTDIFSGTYSLGDIVDALKEHMGFDNVLESEVLIFVCHSMGGIVVRKYLLERQAELIEDNKKIGIFLVASPSLGSSYADWLKPLAKLLGHAQADALRFVKNNTWLEDLDRQFMNFKESGRLRIKGKELIEDKFIILKKFFWFTKIVEPFSGRRYFGESFKIPKSDHFSIAKPEHKNSEQHLALCSFIKEILEEFEPDKTPYDMSAARPVETLVSDLGSSGRRSSLPIHIGRSERAAPSPKRKLFLEKIIPTWRSRILNAQGMNARGIKTGIRIDPYDENSQEQSWVTSQCLVGLLWGTRSPYPIDDIAKAFDFIEARRRKEPEGWSYYEDDPETLTHISGWALLAYAAALESGLASKIANSATLSNRIAREADLILTRQTHDGGYSPVRHCDPENARTYTTSISIWALHKALHHRPELRLQAVQAIRSGVKWLLDNQLQNLWWVPRPQRRSQKDRHLGLDAHVLAVLAELAGCDCNCAGNLVHDSRLDDAKRAFTDTLAEWLQRGQNCRNNESIRDLDEHLTGTSFRIQSTAFAWCPWSYRAIQLLRGEDDPSVDYRQHIEGLSELLLRGINATWKQVGTDGTWELGEYLFCVGSQIQAGCHQAQSGHA